MITISEFFFYLSILLIETSYSGLRTRVYTLSFALYKDHHYQTETLQKMALAMFRDQI